MSENPQASSLKSTAGTAWLWSAAILIGLGLTLVNCGGTNVSLSSNPPRGTLSISVTDPPTCMVPMGNFKKVYVTIRSVQAHISGNATDNSGGWQELAPNLASNPMQLDLFSLSSSASGGCAFAQLSSNVSLPVGDYQQIRLLLVANNPAAGTATPATNACGGNTYNCVVLADDRIHPLLLSSQANTGLKIPPGQIVGGPLRVQDGQHIDVNIDFNACASIVRQGNQQFRLKPTLTAGQVSTSSTGLSGQVVDSVSGMPITGGEVIVALEQADSTGVDRIITQTAVDSSGNFNFCPVPSGMYDVVVVGTDGNGVAYGPTIILDVMQGTSLGAIPLIAQMGVAPDNTPATIQGLLTSSSGTAPSTTGVNIDASLSAMQTIQLSSSSSRLVTIPLLAMSTPLVPTASGMTCPMGTNCAQYTLIVPASNPSIKQASVSGSMFSTPVIGDVNYTVEAQAFAPMSGGTPICTPSVKTTDKDSADMQLQVNGGMTVTAKQIDFTGCS